MTDIPKANGLNHLVSEKVLDYVGIDSLAGRRLIRLQRKKSKNAALSPMGGFFLSPSRGLD